MSARQKRLPTALAALAAGVPEATVRKWASRGKLTRYGTPGRAEYEIDELFALMADDTRQSSANNRQETV